MGWLIWILQWALTGFVGFIVGCAMLIGGAWILHYVRLDVLPRPLTWSEIALDTVGYYTSKRVSDRMLSWIAPAGSTMSMQIPALQYYVG